METKEFFSRVGTFLIMLGIGGITFFVISDMAKDPYFNYLFGGLFLTGSGIYLQKKAAPPPPSGRFEGWKKMREKNKEKKK